jgi:hypothetical protein
MSYCPGNQKIVTLFRNVNTPGEAVSDWPAVVSQSGEAGAKRIPSESHGL